MSSSPRIPLLLQLSTWFKRAAKNKNDAPNISNEKITLSINDFRAVVSPFNPPLQEASNVFHVADHSVSTSLSRFIEALNFAKTYTSKENKEKKRHNQLMESLNKIKSSIDESQGDTFKIDEKTFNNLIHSSYIIKEYSETLSQTRISKDMNVKINMPAEFRQISDKLQKAYKKLQEFCNNSQRQQSEVKPRPPKDPPRPWNRSRR